MPLKDTIERIRKLPEPPNEESAKAQLIFPVLGELGWRSDDPSHVFFEYAAGGGRVDIALRAGDRSVAFVEAKAPGKNLSDHVSQMLQYAFHEGVRICVLTTGLEWWLYLPREEGPPSERRFATLHLATGSPEEIATLLEKFLGRSALVGQSAESDAKEALRSLREKEKLRVEIPRVWQKMLDGSDPDLIALVVERVREQAGLEASPADIAASLGMSEPEPKPQPISLKPPIEPKPPKGKKTSRPTAFRLWGHESPASSYAKILVGVCAAIHRRHESEFIHKARSLWGSYRPWVSSDPTELIRPVAVENSDWYAEVNLSAAAITSRCQRLLEAFGYGGSDLKILVD